MNEKDKKKEKVNKQYSKEFRENAIRLALYSDHSTVHVARLLGMNESTLASWVAAVKKNLPRAKGADNNVTMTGCNSQEKMQFLTESEQLSNTNNTHQKSSALELMKMVIDKLKLENQTLRQERDLLQHALSATVGGGAIYK